MANKGKRERLELEKKIRRAKQLSTLDTCDPNVNIPPDAILADRSQLAHNQTISPLPRFYVDINFSCRNCGTEEIWTAEQQKWWYEEIKGSIFSHAVLCLACRNQEKNRKSEARRIHLEGLANKENSQKS